MAKVEKARAEMFEDVCRLFTVGVEESKATALVDKYYRPIFDYQWNREEDYFGHVLLDRGKIAGFAGAFFVQRQIGGIQRNFSNLTTWLVREENRSESILLIMPFLRMKNSTVTGRTAAPNIFAVHQKLGFRYLDDRAVIIPTFVGRRNDNETVFLAGLNDFSRALSEDDLRLVHDHAPYKCHSCVLQRGARTLLFIVTLQKKWGIPVACIQYMNDVKLFLELLPQVKKEVAGRLKVTFLWIEKRLMRGAKIPFSFEYRSPFVHIYKSNELEPSDIDNLYTEMVVFNTLENRFD